MSDDESENLFGYQSGDDDDNVDDENNIVVPKKSRGQGKVWEVLKLHETLAVAKESMLSRNLPDVQWLTGRVTRGKTLAFYFKCVKRSCGCTKEWRICTALDSYFVTEEESTGDHTNHEKEERNGGRGLSFDQVKMVDDAFAIGVKKPFQFIEYFTKTAKNLLEAGYFLITYTYLLQHCHNGIHNNLFYRS